MRIRISHMNILRWRNTSCFNQLDTLLNKAEACLVEKCCETNTHSFIDISDMFQAILMF